MRRLLSFLAAAALSLPTASPRAVFAQRDVRPSEGTVGKDEPIRTRNRFDDDVKSKKKEADDEAEEAAAAAITEERLPPVGDPKRVAALIKLAQAYLKGRAYKDACARFDQVENEGGDLKADAADAAGRAFLRCAEAEIVIGQIENAEKLLGRSESVWGKRDEQRTVRIRIARALYRRSLANGDLTRALSQYQDADRLQHDEEEQIFLGQALADRAWQAYRLGDAKSAEQLLALVAKHAPRNPDAKRLRETIAERKQAIPLALTVGVGSLLLVFIGRQLFNARLRKKLGGAAGKAAAVGDDDSDLG